VLVEPHHRWRRTLLVCLALLATAAVRAATVPEHELKLALTYKVAKFVSWPAARESAPTFLLCVLGENPFEDALDGIVGLTIKERAIAVKHGDSIVDLGQSCDLVFISRSESERLAEILVALEGEPVLTVSDAPRFADLGGIVELESRGSRIGFTINVGAYRRAGLTISSQLLELATLTDSPQAAEP
jgi:hypothetical protein